MPVQQLNDEMVELLAAKLQRRYESNFAWVNSLSAYNNLPAVRGYWPLSNSWITAMGFPYTSNMVDASSSIGISSIRLGFWGWPTHWIDGLAASLDFNGVTDFLESIIVNQTLDIIGNETFVDVAITGIAGGCWFRPDTLVGNKSLLTRWDSAGQQVFSFYIPGATNTLSLLLQTAAGAVAGANSASVVRVDEWQFGAFTYWTTGGNGYGDIYLSTGKGVLEQTPYTALGMTTIVSANNVPLRIGAIGAWLDYFDGRIANAFLCASRCSSIIIHTLYQQTRALYGV